MSVGKIKWQPIVAKYSFPETWRSLWQVVNSAVPFFVLWYLAYRSLVVGYWLTLLVTIPAAGFMVRMFIIFHDCCHGSFFKSQLANDRLGLLLGAAVWTPYYEWKHSHAMHHATAGDLRSVIASCAARRFCSPLAPRLSLQLPIASGVQNPANANAAV